MKQDDPVSRGRRPRDRALERRPRRRAAGDGAGAGRLPAGTAARCLDADTHRPRPARRDARGRGRRPGPLRGADRGAGGVAQSDRPARPGHAPSWARGAAAGIHRWRPARFREASSFSLLVSPSRACAVVQVGVGLESGAVGDRPVRAGQGGRGSRAASPRRPSVGPGPLPVDPQGDVGRARCSGRSRTPPAGTGEAAVRRLRRADEGGRRAAPAPAMPRAGERPGGEAGERSTSGRDPRAQAEAAARDPGPRRANGLPAPLPADAAAPAPGPPARLR